MSIENWAIYSNSTYFLWKCPYSDGGARFTSLQVITMLCYGTDLYDGLLIFTAFVAVKYVWLGELLAQGALLPDR